MANERSKAPNSRAEMTSRGCGRSNQGAPDAQDGLIDRAQLLAAGLSDRNIRYRRQTGRLAEVHRGVYAVGHISLPRKARLRAASMVGPDVALSHTSGAEWLTIAALREGFVVVTAPHRIRRPRLIAHHRALPDDELEEVDGALVTSVSRTLFDLAATEGRQPFESALRKAEFRHLTSRTSLPHLLARYPGRPGQCARAGRCSADKLYLLPTESWLEDVFLPFLVAREIEVPGTNVEIETAGGRCRVDCLWPAQRLIVELDGRETHDTDSAFEDDRDRDGDLVAAGYRVLRFTYDMVRRRPDVVERRLRAALADRAGSPAA